MLSDGDGKVEATAEGNGMVDAAIAAIAEATGVSGTVLDFNVSSVTEGGDALGDVVIQLEVDGLKATGRGVATDIVEASARAYLAAVNRIIRMRERPQVRGHRSRAMTVNLWTEAAHAESVPGEAGPRSRAASRATRCSRSSCQPRSSACSTSAAATASSSGA